MIDFIKKYKSNIFRDPGLYLALLLPMLTLFLLKSSEKVINIDRKNIFTTSVAIITLSIGFCYQAFNSLNNIDTKDLFYKKLLKLNILDEVRFLYSANIFINVANIIVLVLFNIITWFKIVDNSQLLFLALLPSFTSLYALSEFINYYKTGVGLKKYKIDFEKIHIDDD
ncbi:hypothetical protein [uncultured Methanolobus sp.]|uniref:hypothetical protein n=1 Tax=uncultured Methanolobus sp. TaxID=218300 RepID=UPI002AAB298F|nr:hypothetical protein [uncultured Methanolobus sp.]